MLSIGVSYAYAAWSPPSAMPTGGNAEAPVNVGGSVQVKSGALTVNGLLTAVSKIMIGGTGTPPGGLTLGVAGNTGSDAYCDRDGNNCTAATALGGSGSVAWGSITGRPAGLDDGDDVGITSETDPTVIPSVKDGVSWGEVSGKPSVIVTHPRTDYCGGTAFMAMVHFDGTDTAYWGSDVVWCGSPYAWTATNPGWSACQNALQPIWVLCTQ